MFSFLRAVLRSYALLFFSQHLGFGGLLLLATFARPVAGALGLGATVAALGAARLLGFNREWTDRGTYSFNALLVGLLLGAWYAPGLALVGLVAVGAGLALLLSVAVGGWLGGRGLPALSLPFVAVVWLLLAAAGAVPGLKLGDGGIYWLNDVYALGGARLVAAAEWTQALPWPPLLATYLRSLSSVVVQDSAVAGVLVGAGLLWHSRIAFTLSGLAFLAAYAVAWGTGTLVGPVETFNLGANYMMAALAVGCVFVVPSAASYGLALLTVPVTAVLLAGLGTGLAKAGLPALSLPYAVSALLFLYVLLLRERPGPALALTPVQRFSPEENLYAYVLDRQRLAHRAFVPLTLPVLGAWQVSQGYADATGPTHLGEWGAALDFVLADAEGRTFAGAGTRLADFYAYGKPVVAPADGVVETVIQHIPDNPIGTVNTADNWGNTVVLRHGPALFTQLSHLRPAAVPVKPGDTVRRGDIIGYCGNSGRSPEPHVHFQVQTTPYVGSRTLVYPLAYYVVVKTRSAAAGPTANGTIERSNARIVSPASSISAALMSFLMAKEAVFALYTVCFGITATSVDTLQPLVMPTKGSKTIVAAAKMVLTAAKMIFAAVRMVLAAAKIIFAAAKMIFARVRMILAAAKMIFTAAKTILTRAKMVFARVRMVVADSKTPKFTASSAGLKIKAICQPTFIQVIFF